MDNKQLIDHLLEKIVDAEDKEIFLEAIRQLEEEGNVLTTDNLFELYEGIGNEKNEVDENSAKKAEADMSVVDGGEVIDPLHKGFNAEPKAGQEPSNIKTEDGEQPGMDSKSTKLEDFAKKLNDAAKKKVSDNKALGEGINVSEDVSKIFEGEEFSDEFKEKANTILESSVKTKINEEVHTAIEVLVESATSILEEELESIEDRLSKYLEYIAETFIVENAIAIENGIKSELAENILEGIKTFLVETGIDIPDEKIDIVDAVIAENDSIKEAYNEQAETVMDLKEELKVMKKKAIVEDICEGLTDLEKAKMTKIFEDLEYSDDVSFSKKANILMAAHSIKVNKVPSKVILHEDVDELKELPKSKSSKEAEMVTEYIKKNFN
jgi:hypothetical protein